MAAYIIYLDDISIFVDLLEDVEQTVEAARQHLHQWNNPVNERKCAPRAPPSRMLTLLRTEVFKVGNLRDRWRDNSPALAAPPKCNLEAILRVGSRGLHSLTCGLRCTTLQNDWTGFLDPFTLDPEGIRSFAAAKEALADLEITPRPDWCGSMSCTWYRMPGIQYTPLKVMRLDDALSNLVLPNPDGGDCYRRWTSNGMNQHKFSFGP